MLYDITVQIEDPNTEEGMHSGLTFDLTANFAYDPETYGNGYSVSINGKDFFNVYDLRYNHEFNRKNKILWLATWAENYWSGENGSWKLRSLKISRVSGKEG